MNEIGKSLSEDIGLSYTTNLILNQTPQCSALTMTGKFFKKIGQERSPPYNISKLTSDL